MIFLTTIQRWWFRRNHKAIYEVNFPPPSETTDGSGDCDHDDCIQQRWYVQNATTMGDDPRIQKLGRSRIFAEVVYTHLSKAMCLPRELVDDMMIVAPIVAFGLSILDSKDEDNMDEVLEGALASALPTDRLLADELFTEIVADTVVNGAVGGESPMTIGLVVMAMVLLKQRGGPQDPDVMNGEQILAAAFGEGSGLGW